MEQLIARCAGIDVGQAESMVCVRVPDAVTGVPAELIASYGTTTPDLLELVDWLRGLGVTHVAMESTGVYWKPIYYLMEDDFTVAVVRSWPPVASVTSPSMPSSGGARRAPLAMGARRRGGRRCAAPRRDNPNRWG